ncbi:MAG: glycine zipper domain-containing protein [Flavisolibacter sp.]
MRIIETNTVFFYLFRKSFMPQSRKRPGHHEYRKPADIPARQRTKGRTTWAILFGVFGLIVSYFAAGDNYVALIIGALIGALIGYVVGKNMEKEASH